jgi:hypothetical protein
MSVVQSKSSWDCARPASGAFPFAKSLVPKLKPQTECPVVQFKSSWDCARPASGAFPFAKSLVPKLKPQTEWFAIFLVSHRPLTS